MYKVYHVEKISQNTMMNKSKLDITLSNFQIRRKLIDIHIYKIHIHTHTYIPYTKKNIYVTYLIFQYTIFQLYHGEQTVKHMK